MNSTKRERERRGEATKGLQEDTRKEKMRENGRYKGSKEVKEKKRKKKKSHWHHW